MKEQLKNPRSTNIMKANNTNLHPKIKSSDEKLQGNKHLESNLGSSTDGDSKRINIKARQHYEGRKICLAAKAS